MKVFLKTSLFIIGILLAAGVSAQENKPLPIRTIPVKNKKDILKDSIPAKDSIVISKKGIRQTDVTDALKEAFGIKPEPVADTVTSKPAISIIPAIGYSLVSRFGLVLSGNAAFRTGPQSRISTVLASTAITQNKQFTLPVLTSIWSKDNRYNFIGDYRFLKYPQSTFGLGSSSNIKNQDPLDYYLFRFNETVLRHIAGNFYAGAGYILDNYWDISDKGNLDKTVSDYSVYGKTSHSISSGFTLNLLLDSRNNGINPSRGAYASVQYRNNYELLGSTSNWRSLIVDIRKYYKFPEGSDNVIAFWSYDWLILDGKPPYLNLPSTQWDAFSQTGRGYIQGRFRGAQMVYLESEYRYNITANGLLGGVVFINAQSFSAAPGTRLQRLQPGYGPGLRLKLNTISKTNLTVDYGFGSQGSNGLFVGVGEVF
jgi:hypothetical protein